MFVDFTNLNWAYPKDNLSFRRIDQLVNLTAENELLNFVDAFSRYNLIQISLIN